jgi:hypothetical protein
MRLHPLAAALAAIAVIGCGSQATSSAGGVIPARAGRPYKLYTHCGIEWARIDGTFWRATRPLFDGNGNPPAGWGNPVQNGTHVFISRMKARFESRAGTLTFWRTSRRRPPVLCS